MAHDAVEAISWLMRQRHKHLLNVIHDFLLSSRVPATGSLLAVVGRFTSEFCHRITSGIGFQPDYENWHQVSTNSYFRCMAKYE